MATKSRGVSRTPRDEKRSSSWKGSKGLGCRRMRRRVARHTAHVVVASRPEVPLPHRKWNFETGWRTRGNRRVPHRKEAATKGVPRGCSKREKHSRDAQHDCLVLRKSLVENAHARTHARCLLTAHTALQPTKRDVLSPPNLTIFLIFLFFRFF